MPQVLALRPQDLFPFFHKSSSKHDLDATAQTWCLPHGRHTGADALKKLTGDVEELMVRQESLRLAGAAERERRSLSETAGGSPRRAQDMHAVSEDVHKQLNSILALMRGLEADELNSPTSPKRSSAAETVKLLEKLIAADLPAQLLAQMDILEFDARTDVMNVCSALLRPDMPERIDQQVVEYFRNHPTVFRVLVDGYANEETALHYGVVLRSCARHRELVEAFLASGLAHDLVKHAARPCVDVSSDAFYTLREMLLEHKDVSAPWLERNFAEFFRQYNYLLESGDYIAQRQAQKLLTDTLLDKHFNKVMLAYVSSERNLQIHMVLLKDRSKVIQLEAFQVFKVFVANPAKPAPVQRILYRNRSKLVSLLESLQTAKPEDTQLCQHLRGIVARLSALSPAGSPRSSKEPPATPAPSSKVAL